MSPPCRLLADYECLRLAINQMLNLVNSKKVAPPDGLGMIVIAIKDWLARLGHMTDDADEEDADEEDADEEDTDEEDADEEDAD